MDASNEIVAMAFQHWFDITAYYGCWGEEMSIRIINGSFF